MVSARAVAKLAKRFGTICTKGRRETRFETASEAVGDAKLSGIDKRFGKDGCSTNFALRRG